jgi:hypothetical protein
MPSSPQLLDRLGAAGSLVCAVHCALLPATMAALPVLGVAVASGLGDRFEAGFVVYAALLGSYSLLRGYRRHRVRRGIWLLLAGLATLGCGVAYAPLHEATVPHAIAMTLGGAMVGLAHLLNLRFARACGIAPPARAIDAATGGPGPLAPRLDTSPLATHHHRC